MYSDQWQGGYYQPYAYPSTPYYQQPLESRITSQRPIEFPGYDHLLIPFEGQQISALIHKTDSRMNLQWDRRCQQWVPYNLPLSSSEALAWSWTNTKEDDSLGKRIGKTLLKGVMYLPKRKTLYGEYLDYKNERRKEKFGPNWGPAPSFSEKRRYKYFPLFLAWMGGSIGLFFGSAAGVAGTTIGGCIGLVIGGASGVAVRNRVRKKLAEEEESIPFQQGQFPMSAPAYGPYAGQGAYYSPQPAQWTDARRW